MSNHKYFSRVDIYLWGLIGPQKLVNLFIISRVVLNLYDDDCLFPLHTSFTPSMLMGIHAWRLGHSYRLLPLLIVVH